MPILLLDLWRKLELAILELSKDKNQFSTSEILLKLRELERKSVERVLRRLRLRFVNGKWQMNSKIFSDVKNTWIKWPFFGMLILKEASFKLLGSQSRTVYVDVPNETILDFIGELNEICDKYKTDYEKMYEEARKIANNFNKQIEKEIGD